MHVLLFDLHVGGHHLEYAGKLQTALRRQEAISGVTFGAPEPTPTHTDYFDTGDIEYVFDEGTGNLEGIHESPLGSVRGRILSAAVKELSLDKYDVVHLVHIDDLAGPVLSHLSGTLEAALVGTINGVFFREYSERNHRIAAGLLGAVPSPLLSSIKLIPDGLTKNPPLNYLAMGLLLRHTGLDALLVHSEKASEMIQSLTPSDDVLIDVVIDPLEPATSDRVNSNAAKRNVGAPEDQPLLLFFGEMRAEKGLSFMLNALSSYDGPPFTLFLAGKEVDDDHGSIEEVELPGVNLLTDVGYVAEAEVERYFAAADGVVLPYRRSYGVMRTSGVFQKACGYGLPLVVPGFGVIGDQVDRWNLGLTFDVDSGADFRNTVSELVASPQTIASATETEAYIAAHSYEQLAADLVDIYEDC